MNVLLLLAEAFIVAYLMKLAANRVNVPAVSGFVIGGVILGGSLFFWIPGGRDFVARWLYTDNVLKEFQVINQIALGLIALSIGSELEWKRLKTLGRSIMFIAFFEAFGAFLLVSIVVLAIWRNLPLALVLGAVSSGTAPAATVAVIQQYRAKGPLTSTVLAVVGLDDAISFIIFAFALAIAKSNIQGENINLVIGLVRPMLEIFISLFLGTAAGLVTAKIISFTDDRENLVFLLGAVMLLVAGLASSLDVSELLANMAYGAVLVNVSPLIKKKIRMSFGEITPIFYALFFIIGGAHLNLYSLPSIWFIALIYFACRSTGKIAGAFIGAIGGKAMPQVKDWIGFTLLPQVGAAVALALVVQDEFGGGNYGDKGINLSQITINVLLITTLLTEFVGPYLTKISLIKAGEAKE